jgi:peroxiredoxin
MSWKSCFSYPVCAVFLAIALSGCLEDDVEPLALGVAAPPATLTLLDGATTEMSAVNGGGRVISFMASWCPCSHDSIPLMKKAYARYEEDGISFLMVGIQDAEGKFEKFVAKWEVPFPAGYDAGDRIARAYGVSAPPTTIFVDRQGRVKRVFYGNIKDKEEEFLQWTEELL